MPGLINTCLVEIDLVEKTTLLTTVIAFVSMIVVISCGLKLNYRFLVKLRVEKRARPLGRKGNVIEPIASLFCIIQMIYWPYNMLLMWSIYSLSAFIPSDFWMGWHSTVLWNLGIKMGRVYIASNSLFTSLIRYIYIVHHERSNQWEFEKVGKFFCISSFVIPLTLESIGFFTDDMNMIQRFWPQKELADCLAFYLNVNSTHIEIPYPPDSLQLTMAVLPESVIYALRIIYAVCVVPIFSNVIEFILYLRIYQTIKRSNMHNREIGVLSDANYEYAEKRSIISLKMCTLGWIYELISNTFVILAPLLKFKYDLPNTYFVDPITMFVVIPFLYLFNDEDTKEIVYNESWYQGIKYVFGVYVAPVQEENEKKIVAVNPRHGTLNQNHSPAVNNQRNDLSSARNGILSQQHRCQSRLYKSLSDIRSGPRPIRKLKLKVMRRHFSSPGNLFQGKQMQETIQEAETILIRRKYSFSGSDASLETLNID